MILWPGFSSYFYSTCLELPQAVRFIFPSRSGWEAGCCVSVRAVMSKLLLSMGSFLFPWLAAVEEQNSSSARRRATGDDEGTSLKQPTLLCSFSPYSL